MKHHWPTEANTKRLSGRITLANTDRRAHECLDKNFNLNAHFGL